MSMELSSCDVIITHTGTLSHDQAYLGNVVSIIYTLLITLGHQIKITFFDFLHEKLVSHISIEDNM